MGETFHFEIIADNIVVAEGEGSDQAAVWNEAFHYGRMYGQDGPVKVILGRGPLPEPQP